MVDEQTYVAMLKDTEPEEFMFVTVNPGRGAILRTVHGLSQGDMEAALHKMGMPWDEIKSKVDHARKNPV
jgi:hypothetical protein